MIIIIIIIIIIITITIMIGKTVSQDYHRGYIELKFGLGGC